MSGCSCKSKDAGSSLDFKKLRHNGHDLKPGCDAHNIRIGGNSDDESNVRVSRPQQKMESGDFYNNNKQEERQKGTAPRPRCCSMCSSVHPMSWHHDMRGATTCTALPDPLQLFVFGTTPVSAQLWFLALGAILELKGFKHRS